MTTEMSEQDKRNVLIAQIVDEYKFAYGLLDNIIDYQARVRATNMILMDRSLPRRSMPDELGFSTADKTAEAPKEPAPEEASVETDYSKDAYGKSRRWWDHCPECGSENIHHESTKPGKDGKTRTYQACFECGIFLQRNGDKKEMDG